MIRRLVSLMALGSLAACNLTPAYHRPAPAIPPSWPVGDAYLRASEATLPTVRFQDIFRDARLQALVAQAIANNQDLRAAIANVAAAQAQYRVQRAELFPEVDASGRVTTGRNSRNGTNIVGTNNGTGAGGSTVGGTGSTIGGTGNAIGGTGGNGSLVTSSSGRSSTSYALNLGTTSFELDLFGRLRSLSNAAFDIYLGQEAAARSARLALVAQVATEWLTLASDRSLLQIAQQTAKSAETSVALTRARLEGGVAPRTDLRQAEQVLDVARSDEAALLTAVAQDRNALELLVGAKVADAALAFTIEDAAQHLGELPAGLSSEVLLRRPDVVQAEYNLRAANARIGAARANFFPRISLTAVAGLASTALSTLFTGGAFNWTVAPSATLPLFTGGANRGNLAYARAERDYAVATYQSTIQTAFREVADALARRGTIDRQLAADAANERAAADTLFLDTARYRQGIDPYLNSLDAQRSEYTAQRTLITTRFTRAQNLVTLYQTLGGSEQVQPGSLPPAR